MKFSLFLFFFLCFSINIFPSILNRTWKLLQCNANRAALVGRADLYDSAAIRGSFGSRLVRAAAANSYGDGMKTVLIPQQLKTNIADDDRSKK